MPPPPHNNPGVIIIETFPGDTDSTIPPGSARALLRSLEELRDSLSLRVGQLATAVERLRLQAGELETSIGGSRPTRRSLSGSSQFPNSVIRPHPRRIAGTATTPQPHITTSVIATELSQLDRPITSAEIHRLLDRASASLSSTADLRAAELEGTLDGLREVRISLQGHLQGLSEMEESEDRLRARRARREAPVNLQVEPAQRPAESLRDKAIRRAEEIEKESAERREASRRGCRTTAREASAHKAAAGTIGLLPTNTFANHHIVVRSSGVKPPPAHCHPAPPPPQAGTSHIHPAFLDAMHREIAELDLNLEPTEYMEGLTGILRRASLPDSTMEDMVNAIQEMILGEGNEVGVTVWETPSSPTSSTSSNSTAIGDARENGLTYRGRDVQDRMRTPSGSELPAGYLVASDPSPVVSAGTIIASTSRPSTEAQMMRSIELEALRRDRVTRAQEIVQDHTRSRQEAARSARELISAAAALGRGNTGTTTSDLVEPPASRTAITMNAAPYSRRLPAATAVHRGTEEYLEERTILASLRAARARRTEAYSRLQDFVGSRARQESQPRRAVVAAPPLPSALDLGMDPGQPVISVTSRQLPDPANDDEERTRHRYNAAQLEVESLQQRLTVIQSRRRMGSLRQVGISAGETTLPATVLGQDRVGPSDNPEVTRRRAANVTVGEGLRATIRDMRERSARDMVEDGVLPATIFRRRSEATLTVGPRGESAEEVDTLLRIGQLRGDLRDNRERITNRRRHLANVRESIARQHQLAAVGQDTPDWFLDLIEDRPLDSLMQDARDVDEAQRELYRSLELDEVTPSSPITANGSGRRDYSHIQVSIGPDSDASQHQEADGTLFRRIVESHVGSAVLAQDSRDVAATDTLSAEVQAAVGSERDVRRSRGEFIPEPSEIRSDPIDEIVDGDKNEGSALDSAPTQDTTELRAHMWQVGAQGRRTERPYISLLDL